MYNTRQREAFNFYESFSDLIFCTLVLFLVLVLFLALNVNLRIEGVRETEKTLELRKTEVAQGLEELEIEKKQLQQFIEDNKSKVEKFWQLKAEEARLVKLKEESEAEDRRLKEIERKNADAAKHKEEVEKQIALVTTRLEALKKEELDIKDYQENLNANQSEIALLEKIKVLVEDKETARNRLYDTAGEDDDSGLVPCRWRYHVLLVVGSRGRIAFQGQRVTWEQLPGFLARVSNREQTVLDIAVTKQLIEMRNFDAIYERIEDRVKQVSGRFGFEYFSNVGIERFQAKGGKRELIPIQLVKK